MIRKYRVYILFALILAVAVVLYAIFKGIWTFPNLSVGKGVGLLLNAVASALYCLALSFSVVSGRNKLKASFGKASVIALWSVVLGLAGKFVSEYLLPGGSPLVLPLSMAGILAVTLIIYLKCRKRAADKVSSTAIRKSAAVSGQLKYTYPVLYGALTVMMAADIIHYSVTFRGVSWNQETLIPLVVTLISLILWRIVKWRGPLAIAVATDIFYLSALLHAFDYTCGFQALGASLAAFLVFVSVIIPISDLYFRKEENI